MKEYIAKSGGRYTYNDDLLNLQDLAMSMAAMFDGCSNFIISGCHFVEGRITPGFVWINDKVRKFEGNNSPTFPFYIYERNSYETITYAGDINKHGRCNYMAEGSSSVPQTMDEVTGSLPGFIEVGENYAPRLVDKFIGKYALLLDTPFSTQTVKKDLTLNGSLSVDKDIVSHKGISVLFPETGHVIKNSVKSTGEAAVGLNINGQLITELTLSPNGKFSVWNHDNELFSVDSTALKVARTIQSITDCGAIRIQDNDIFNFQTQSNDGELRINRFSYNGTTNYSRNFGVYGGLRDKAILFVEGRASKVMVNGLFEIITRSTGFNIKCPSYKKTDRSLRNSLHWLDSVNESLGFIGFEDIDTYDLTLCNEIGNIILSSRGWVDINGELRIGGVNIEETYITIARCEEALGKKVDKIDGKGLSTEDFTSAYKKKLDAISTSDLETGGEGFITAREVTEGLRLKLTASQNLADLPNKESARVTLSVYSKSETDGRYYQVKNFLSEVTALSASEVDGKTPEQIIEMKESRQQAARNNIAAEKEGTGSLKLDKSYNLSDLPDKAKARQNISVYSIEQIEQKLAGKLDSTDGYSGVPFTSELKAKLDGIKTGNFAGTDANGASVTQIEGYLLTSDVLKELAKYAPKLLAGYSAADKATIATNINVYSKTEGDVRYGKVSSLLQDYISHQTATGVTTANAQKVLRDRLGAAASADLSNYLTKTGKLTDLTVSSDTDRKNICSRLGAAYAADYQTKLSDTGWITCGGSNSGTLFARQIGNIVCIQGRINTARRTGGEWGGVVATIPNTISPPKYACKTSLTDWDNGDKRNRGTSLVINAGSRTIYQYTAGWNNMNTEIHITYMT